MSRCPDNAIARGSPPQVRGKRRRGKGGRGIPRITPAGAGKTLGFAPLAGGFPDHPRRCGENLLRCLCPALWAGSPPQVRGKLGHIMLHHSGRRITPAGAGKTQFHRDPAACIRDHPRRCGENREIHDEWDGEPGSPPQVRGKRLPPLVSIATGRITPAGAGKTLPFCNISFSLRDHPRRCGENRRLG